VAAEQDRLGIDNMTGAVSVGWRTRHWTCAWLTAWANLLRWWSDGTRRSRALRRWSIGSVLLRFLG